ncbi:hypothetical protein KQY27_07035 [Methanobrevibacter sp. TMH8]|uniref:hypothetical protein n=1 Tax=Methanobrevibacter sp. TMH8 TaxID=2848611 RepID=UPI001CCB3BA5|nr:hypothetical protein [Methanobrevibacter sp. TMH8]MBZ9571296.1 hypothetical protein [Methanobrevibacter sp. TMH8]
MSEISENIIFKRDSGEKIEVPEKFVGLKARQEGILTVNFRTPQENIEEIKNFFEGFKSSQPLTYDIGNTGEVQCYFKGVAPLLQQKDEAGFEYYFLSVTLQELKNNDADDDLPSCGGCV